MISIEIGDPNLRTATTQNHMGEWIFLLPTEKPFSLTGHWKDVRPKAEAHALACGFKDGQDSICLLGLQLGETK